MFLKLEDERYKEVCLNEGYQMLQETELALPSSSDDDALKLTFKYSYSSSSRSLASNHSILKWCQDFKVAEIKHSIFSLC